VSNRDDGVLVALQNKHGALLSSQRAAGHQTPRVPELHRAVLCCNVLQCVAACCSVLQCVSVCCSCRRRNFRSAPSSPVLPPPHTQSPHTHHTHIHITCTTHTHHTHTAPATGREARGCRVLSKNPCHKSHVKRAQLRIKRGLSCIKRAMSKEPCKKSPIGYQKRDIKGVCVCQVKRAMSKEPCPKSHVKRSFSAKEPYN